LRVGVVYESTQYTRFIPGYSVPSVYQTIGPVLHAEPSIWKWLSIRVDLYPLYIIDPPRFGAEITVGPSFHISDRLQGAIEYSYYDLPGSVVRYSGNGLQATLTFRF
jgi:hypothetical protein